MIPSMIIAIDGPAGAGKSTVCRLLATTLGYVYLDSGAMYRAIAWALVREGLAPEDERSVALRLPLLPLQFSIHDAALMISYEGKPLGDELRQPEITQEASRISRIACVRAFLVQWQRRLGAQGRIVAEGRDMTTVVFAEAAVKVFLTADLATRVQRRQAEYLQKGISIDYPTLELQIRTRDEADQARALSPLRPAPDALVLDTSVLGISEVVHRLLQFISEKAEAR